MSNNTAAIITGLGIGTMLIVAQLPILVTAGMGMAATAGVLYTHKGYETGRYSSEKKEKNS